MESKLQETTALPMLSTPEQTSTQARPWQHIARSAYLKAEARGFNPGHALDDWLETERELAAAMIDEELAA